MSQPAATRAPLTGAQKRHLRGLAHHLSPIVRVGKEGVTDAVVLATDQALLDHELIKVRLPQVEKESRAEMASALSVRTRSSLAGMTGRVALLYRAHPNQPRVRLPRG